MPNNCTKGKKKVTSDNNFSFIFSPVKHFCTKGSNDIVTKEDRFIKLCYSLIVYQATATSWQRVIKFIQHCYSLFICCLTLMQFWAQLFTTTDALVSVSLKLCSLNMAYTLIFLRKKTKKKKKKTNKKKKKKTTTKLFHIYHQNNCELDIVILERFTFLPLQSRTWF